MKQMQLAFREAVSVKFLTDNLGIYLHIPFCKKKCKYCDFYSSFVTEELIDNYTAALISSIKQWGGGLKSRPIDTIYLGGGTPSLLNHRLSDVINAVKENFTVLDTCEITLELNPEGDTEDLLRNAKKAGINRLSIGAQSGNDNELSVLGRCHSAKDTATTVKKARELGFSNISLDIMLGLPNSSTITLKQSLDFILDLKPEHISSYILKIEENTAFYQQLAKLNLPDEDNVSDQYLFMCGYLKDVGYSHYEISNFALSGDESRHNLKYWKGKEYLGIGPAAHSFLNGKRFFYPRDLKAFVSGNSPCDDGEGGSIEEYIMLNLRLKDGLCTDILKTKFGVILPDTFYKTLSLFEKEKLLTFSQNTISLTDKGMLLSNSIITELLECIE